MLGGIEDRPAVEGLVVGPRVHDRGSGAVVDLLGGYRRGGGVTVVGHHVVLVGLQVHLLLVGHEVGDGEGVVEVVVGIHGFERVVLQVQIMYGAGEEMGAASHDLGVEERGGGGH